MRGDRWRSLDGALPFSIRAHNHPYPGYRCVICCSYAKKKGRTRSPAHALARECQQRRHCYIHSRAQHQAVLSRWDDSKMFVTEMSSSCLNSSAFTFNRFCSGYSESDCSEGTSLSYYAFLFFLMQQVSKIAESLLVMDDGASIQIDTVDKSRTTRQLFYPGESVAQSPAPSLRGSFERRSICLGV
jgi:hypothetical protein